MNTYEKALREYENENENGKNRLIYSYFGLAIFYIQILEQTFSTMLWTNRIFKEKVNNSEELNKIIDTLENSKITMGPLIEEVKKSYSLDNKLVFDLKKLLDNRNYLVHKYFKKEIAKCYSDMGRKEILEFFGNFIDQVEIIDAELNNYYKKYKIKLGLTDEKISKIANEMIENELKRI